MRPSGAIAQAVLLLGVLGTHALHSCDSAVRLSRRRAPVPVAALQAAEAKVNEESIRWYLNSIGRHDLLTIDDETNLAMDVQELCRWQSVRDKLEDQLERTPTDDEWSRAVGFEEATHVPDYEKLLEGRCFEHQLESLRKAKEKMINSNLRLVVTIAKGYQNRGLGLQDLIQEGTLGLITAVDKFDPEHASQAKFSSYASWWIKQRVSRSVGKARCIRLPSRMPSLLHAITKARDEYRIAMGREPTHEELASVLSISVGRLRLALSAAREPVSLDSRLVSSSSSSDARTLADVIPDAAPEPSQQLEERMRRQALARTLQSLARPGRNKLLDMEELGVLCSRYDLVEGRGRQLTYEEVGTRFNKPTEWAEAVEARALKKIKGRPQLRNLLQTRGVGPACGDIDS